MKVDEALKIGGKGGRGAGLRSGDQVSAALVGACGGGLEHRFQEGDVEAGALEEAGEGAVFEIVGEGGGFVVVGEVIAAEVDHDAHGRRREELVHVPAAVGDRLEDEDRFEEEIRLVGAEKPERGGAGLRIDEEVDGVLDERVIGREEANVFADNRAGAVEGGEHPIGRNRREALHVGVARVQENVALLVVLDAHAEVVEEVIEKISQEWVGVDGADAFDDPRGDVAVKGVELEQAVAALFHFRRERAAELDRFRNEGVELGPGDLGAAGTVVVREGEEAGLELVLIVVATVDQGFEGIEPAVIPLDDAFLGAAGDVGDVDADGLGLADAVEAADALFEEAGVEREVEEDEVVGELEVAALAADFRADE